MWEKVKLKEICKLVTGKTPPTKNAEYFGEDLMWLTPGDFNEKFIQKSERGVTTLALKDRKINLIPSNSLFITCIGNIGKLTINKVDACSNQQITALCPFSEDVNIEFLYYYLQTIQKHLSSIANNAVVPIINNGILGEIEIPLPPLPIQEKIATILDKADELRRKDKDLQAKYDELAQAIFIDMFGDPVRNEKGWEVKKLGELCSKILSGNTPKGGSEVYVESGIKFFRSQNVWKNRLDLDDIAYIDEATHKKMKNTSLKNKDILITKTGRINTENSSLGRAALYSGENDCANLNGHVYLIRVYSKFIIPEFLVFILTTIQYRDHIRSVCVGGIDKRQLNKEHIQDFPIILPPLHLQEAFAKKIELINQLKAQINAQKSEELFQSLLQKAFEGELVS
ncbi:MULTISPECIES: restriction endonuclease subunit S [Sphingobacterium]|uniref:restriction endonuclease subunit S n=1 Tax=Sphingobacterium TaxID=28453 RepID=UPI0025801DBF|nr:MULTISPECIES: restriction endonuclease subunit S [Sphingobacterium]